MSEFAGRVAIVTGAASGIGLAVSQLLAERGAAVAMFDRDGVRLQRAAADLRSDGHRVHPEAVELTDELQVKQAVERTLAELGQLHVLSNNAGVQRYGTLESMPAGQWDEVMATNVGSVLLVTRACLPHLKVTQGAIVNMASVQSFVSQGNGLAYAASKHALLGVTRSLAMDLAPNGVRVNCVAPGSVDTSMLDWALNLDDDPVSLRREVERMHPLGRIASAREVAECVAFLASDRASFVTGTTLTVDGGLLLGLAGAPRSVS